MFPYEIDLPGLMLFGVVLNVANSALANQLAPGEEAGKFLGLTNIATAGSAAIARLEGPAIDWLNGLHPGQWPGYTRMFVFGVVCMVLGVFLLGKISEKRV